MKIDQRLEQDYETVSVKHVGFVDPYAVEGMVILADSSGVEFPMRAFSGEVAMHIANFVKGSDEGLPTIYRMIEEICDSAEMRLVKVKVYENGESLRANLYFAGRREMLLRNYRASDAIALATFYKIPILIKKTLLERLLPT